MTSAKTPPRQVISTGSYKAALYSLILPGTGQLMLGRRKEAIFAFILMVFWGSLFGTMALGVYFDTYSGDNRFISYVLLGIALIPNYLAAFYAARPVYAPLPAAPVVAKLVPCIACGTELSVAATVCTKCGHPVQRQEAANNATARILLIASIAGGIWWLWGGGYQWYLNGISRDVAADAVAQYRMVEKTGSNMDRCVQAGFVAAAYLQAKDQRNYENWHWIEKAACMNAGVLK